MKTNYLLISILSTIALAFTAAGCRTTDGSSASDTKSLSDASVLRKSQINNNFWLVECLNGLTETHTTAEVTQEKVCESVPVYQYYSPIRKESLYTTNPQSVGPNYGLRGVRFNILPYAMTNELGQPLTQELVHCFDSVQKDHFLSVGNCHSPHESGSFVEKLGYVLKPNQATVGATIQLLRCVRDSSPGIQKDTKYSHDGTACQPNYDMVGSPLGIILKKFPTQSALDDI